MAISNAPGDLSVCNGPYHAAEDIGGGKFVWRHVAEEACSLVHDETKRGVVTTSSPCATANVDIHRDAFDRRATSRGSSCLQWFASEVEKMDMPILPGKTYPKATCTSAGSTTRLIFDLTSKDVHYKGRARHAGVGSSLSNEFGLKSTQDGSIVSSAQGDVHIRISGEHTALRGGDRMMDSRDVRQDNARASSLAVDMAVDGGKLVSGMPLGTAVRKGVLLSLRGLEGTHFVELCLRDHASATGATGHSSCLAEARLSLEAFSPENCRVQKRRSISPRPITTGMDTAAIPRAPRSDAVTNQTQVAFVLDLEVVDGYKLSSLHLMKHLPPDILPSVLDLSCTCEALPLRGGGKLLWRLFLAAAQTRTSHEKPSFSSRKTSGTTPSLPTEL